MLFLFVMQCTTLFSQETTNLTDIFTKVRKAQASLQSVSYKIERTDTLVTDDVRTMKGTVIISVDKADTILGFCFRAKKDNENAEKIYDGHSCYETNTETKTYSMQNSAFALQNMLYGGGGHLVLLDLIKLDTTKNNGITLRVNKNDYDIIIRYPDLTEYNVIKRTKTVTIDKENLLPVAVREHQETDGKVQDLYYHITAIAINPATTYNFSEPPFLKEYAYQPPEPVNTKPKLAKGTSAPHFRLESFDGKMFSSNSYKGKVVLLDFWEVWCSPCIESMPKITALYSKYHNKGLEVYGITNDLKQLSSARAFARRKQINFPLLIGSEQIKKDYHVEAFPYYVLIDRKGIIRMVSLGYTEDLEKVIEDILKH